MKNYLAICLFLVLSAIPLSAQLYHACPVTPPGKAYLNPLLDQGLSDYDVSFYHIDLEVSNLSTEISGSCTIILKLEKDCDSLLLELSSLLEVSDILIDSSLHAGFRHEDDRLSIGLGSLRQTGERLTVQVFYEGDAGQNRGFFAGIKTAKDYKYNQMITYTLSEPMNASDWFPVKEVVDDKADSAWVFITTDQELMAGSGGILEELVDVGSKKHQFRWKTKYPVAYYLLSMTVGDYRDLSFNAPLSSPGDSVLVQNFIYDLDEYQEKNNKAIHETADLIGLYSQKLIDYPFKEEKYGHCLAPMGGGMEHQTMTTLADFSFTLVAHELAHQWFGDYITCGNWRDIWINEGFASYMEYIALQGLRSQEMADDWLSHAMSLARVKDGTVYVPEADVENIWRLFDTALSYKKGACILHMLRFELDNDSLFFAVLRNYLAAFGGGNATAADFRTVLEQTTEHDFSCFFSQWYYGYGYPVFSLTWYQEGDSLFVFSQEKGSSLKTPFFSTPFILSIETENGSRVERLRQEQPDQSWSFKVDGIVSGLVFNGKKDILASGIVNHRLPDGKEYVLGPNPVSESLYLEFARAAADRTIALTRMDGMEAKVFTVSGQVVYLPLSSLEDGPYLLTITDGDKRYTDKILKVSR